MYERLPADVTTDRVSQWNWAEQRLRYVYTYAERFEQANQAQDTALVLYPVGNIQGRAQIEMHRAAALIRSGDTFSGTHHLIRVLERLQPQQRTDMIVLRSAVSALGMVPLSDRGHAGFIEAKEFLISMTGKR